MKKTAATTSNEPHSKTNTTVRKRTFTQVSVYSYFILKSNGKCQQLLRCSKALMNFGPYEKCMKTSAHNNTAAITKKRAASRKKTTVF